MISSVSNRKTLSRMLVYMLCLTLCVSMVMVGSMSVAFCTDDVAGAGDAIQGAVSGMTEQIYSVMRAIIIPMCIIALAFAGFQFLVGGTQGAEKARKAVIGVVLAIAFIVFAPLFGKAIGSWVKDEGTGDWDGYNPLS